VIKEKDSSVPTGGSANIVLRDLRGLTKPRPIQFLVRVVLLLSMLAFFAWSAITLHGLAKVASQVLLGMVFAHGTEIVHQCLHKTGTGRLVADNRIGFVLGALTLISLHLYKFTHHWHHKFNGTEPDKESFGYTYHLMESKRRLVRLIGFARHVSMIDHYYASAHRMVRAAEGNLTADLREEFPSIGRSIAFRIQTEFLFMLGVLGAAAVASIAAKSDWILDLWLVPLLIGWGPTHALMELPEHWNTIRPNGDVFVNTRSIRAGAFARWFTNGNCDHVEHHFHQSVPMDRLPELRQLLDRSGCVLSYGDQTYLRFYVSFIKSLWTGRR
jgi:fatty acid desaturase